MFAAEGKICDPAVWRWNDALHSSNLIGDLNTHCSSNIEPPIAVNTQTVSTTPVERVGCVDPKEALFVLQRSVGLYLVAVDPM